MSRRGFIVRVFVLVQMSIILGSLLLYVSTVFLLDLGPATQRDEFFKIIIYVIAATVLLSALVFWQLRPVLYLLHLWDQGRKPQASTLQRAQACALIFPNRLIAEMIGFVLLLIAVAIYIDVVVSGYQLEWVLINAVLTAAFVLGIGFAINVGLRVFLHAVLTRISMSPLSTLRRFSVQGQVIMAVTVLTTIILVFSTAFIYSYVIKAIDESVGQERIHLLETALLPLLDELDDQDWPEYLAQRTVTDGVLFLLDAQAEYKRQVPPQYDLEPRERQALAQVNEPRFYKRDYSTLRVIVFPLQGGYVLGQAYSSQANKTQTVRVMTRIIGGFVVVSLLLSVVVGGITSQNLVRSVDYVTNRLESLAKDEQAGQHSIIAQTSLDEIGDLVRAFSHVQRQTEMYTAQLRDSVLELENSNDRRQKLLETMVGLTAPVIPVAKGLVVVLLSGYFDQERAHYICPNMLKGIADTRARIAIVDLTAIAQVSEPLTKQLHRAVRSVALMGCQVILTGANADVAWALTQAGGVQAILQTRRNLQDGLAYAYTELNDVGEWSRYDGFTRQGNGIPA